MAEWVIYSQDGEVLSEVFLTKREARAALVDYHPDDYPGVRVGKAPEPDEGEEKFELTPAPPVTKSQFGSALSCRVGCLEDGSLAALLEEYLDLTVDCGDSQPINVLRGREAIANEILEQGRRLNSQWLK